MQSLSELPYRFQFAIDRLERQLIDSWQNLGLMNRSICRIDDEIYRLTEEIDKLLQFSRLVWTDACHARDTSEIRHLVSAFHQSIGSDREIQRLAQVIKNHKSERNLVSRHLEKQKRMHTVIQKTISKLKAHRESFHDSRQPAWNDAINPGSQDEAQEL